MSFFFSRSEDEHCQSQHPESATRGELGSIHHPARNKETSSFATSTSLALCEQWQQWHASLVACVVGLKPEGKLPLLAKFCPRAPPPGISPLILRFRGSLRHTVRFTPPSCQRERARESTQPYVCLRIKRGREMEKS